MKKYVLTILLSAFLVFLNGAANNLNAQTVNLSGSIGKGFIKRGAAEKAAIILDIPAGVHTNSSRPNSEFSVPTSVKVSGSGVKIGTVMYPRGKNKKFEFSEEPLNVYEHRAVFYFIVAVPKNYKAKTVNIRAIVDYQACTDEVCYQPKTQEIILTAKVR